MNMPREADTDFIIVDTNYEGSFRVIITLPNHRVIFCETLNSFNRKIRLDGFSLKKHTVTISPLITEAL